MARRWLLLWILGLLWPLPGWAVDYYVTASGGDPDGPTCPIGTPCTPAYGLATAQAGDTVYFLAGTYVGEMVPNHCATCWDGMVCTERIVFRADPGAAPGTVILRNGYVNGNHIAAGVGAGTFRLMGVDGLVRSCIQIGPGFTFGTDSYPPQVFGCSGGGCPPKPSARGNLVLGNTFNPGNSSGPGSAQTIATVVGHLGHNVAFINNTITNYGGVYQALNGHGGAIVTGNTITRDNSTAGQLASGALEINETLGNPAFVANNRLIASGAPQANALWCDTNGGQSRWINNYVTGPWGNSIRDEFACQANTWEYNIFVGADRGDLHCPGSDGTWWCAARQYRHNTMVDFNWYWYRTNDTSDVIYTNNIGFGVNGFLSAGPFTYDPVKQRTPGGSIFDYNLYCPAVGCGTSANLVELTGTPGAPTETLAEWQAIIGEETHSVVGNPLFVDSANGNYSLQGGSPALGTGELGTNMGACPGNTFACGTPVAIPTITLTATPATVTRGESTILDWSSPTATQGCSASWTPSTGSYGRSAFVVMATTTYTLTCTNAQGSAQANVTVTVLPRRTTPSPTVWLKLNEASGTSAADSSPTGIHPGTLAGGAAFTTGHPGTGNGVLFDGSNDVVTIANHAALSPTGAYAFAAWIQWTTGVAVPMSFVNKGTHSAGATLEYDFALTASAPSGAHAFLRRNNLGIVTHQVDGATLVAPSTWHHVVGIHDGRTMQLYIDGVLQSVNPTVSTLTMVATSEAMRLGLKNTGLQPFKGILDDFRFYADFLTAEEVQAIMTAQSLPPATMAITTNNGADFSTANTVLVLVGDGTAGTTVSWECDVCGSGSATGSTTWMSSNITLVSGENRITVAAADGDGQLRTDTITVTLTGGGEPVPPLYRLVP